MLWIKLDSGRNVYVNGLKYGRTYSGVIASDDRMLQQIIEGINRRKIKEITMSNPWDKRNTLFIQPSAKALKNGLKPAYYIVDLISHTAIDPKFMESSLVVIWLDDHPNQRSLEEIISQGVKQINWEENAKDYDL